MEVQNLNDKVYIIGIAPEGASSLSVSANKIVELAEIVFGGERLLRMFPSLSCEKITIRNNLAEVASLVQSNLGYKRMVVLASGDPNFFGIAKYLAAKLGRQVIEILPNVGAMQVAFARIKENWDDAVLLSVHSRPVEDVIEMVRSSRKIGIFTDDKNTPSIIAKTLLDHGIDNYDAYVCQKLGSESESVVKTTIAKLSLMQSSSPNILILTRKDDIGASTASPRSLGIPDDDFYKRRPKEGLITKQEVRAVSLAKMRLTMDDVVWDIGAGSGAISVEASLLVGKGKVYAIEKNVESVGMIRKNLRKFNVSNVEVIHTSAPDNLDKLLSPNGVFIGGSGGRMEEILDFVLKRLKPGGRIVINIVALEHLNAAITTLKERGFTLDVTMVSIARGVNILEFIRFEALNPVFVVTGISSVKRGA